MWWLKKPAFIIDSFTLEQVFFGEWDEAAQIFLPYIALGCVLVEAPTDDEILNKLIGDKGYFKKYYREYFNKFKETSG